VLAESHPPLEVRVEATTDLSGSYSLALPAGLYDVTVDGTCHGASTVVVEVTSRSVTTAEQVALVPTRCTPLPFVVAGWGPGL
jgi:hypothetical protein